MPSPRDGIGDPDESLLERWLDWQEARADGRTPAVEEICPDDPDGQARLRAYIAAARGFDAVAGDGANAEDEQPRSITCAVDLEVLRFHASGGLGEVYVARDGNLNREVALKRIKAGADRPASRSRFLLEAEVTGGLEHPGIVPVYGIGHDSDGRPYYAMRFIRGHSLRDAIEQFHRADGQPGRDPGERTLALRQLLRRFVDVCNAVAYAHSRNVLHRDLKPGNVMLGPFGETLVVDWGLAKLVGGNDGETTSADGPSSSSSGSGPWATRTGSVVGTPAFMSPEQAEGRPGEVGPASDVYSLGAMLYNLLTGRLPFADADRGERLRKTRSGEFPPPRQANRTVPPALEAVCLKAMAKQAGDRYSTPEALADEIEQWLADEPVSAWREPLSVRARRWMRRHRTAMTGAAAVVLTGLIGLAAVAVVQSRSNRELNKAYGRVSDALDAETKAKKEKGAALVQSEEVRKRAQAVLGFLKDDVLATARPEGDEGGLGKDVPVRKAIDAAEPKIAGAFKDQPLVEAELRDTLGLTYIYLGEAPLAIRQCERALELRLAQLGTDSPDTLESRDHLAVAYLKAGRTTDAITLHEAVLEMGEVALGPNHRGTLIFRNNLAVDYEAAGRYTDAIRLHEETLKRYEANLGHDHPATLDSRHNLAATYLGGGRTAEAIALFKLTLEQRNTKLGTDHRLTLQTRNGLALAYTNADRVADAIPILVETLELTEKKLGPDHPDTLTCRNNLGLAYEKLGLMADAISLHERTLRLEEAKHGTDHPLTLITRSNLANTYRTVGRIADAIRLHEANLKLMESKLRPDHPHAVIMRRNLAVAYESDGRMAEAERLYREELVHLRKIEEPDSPSLATALGSLGNNLLKQAKWPEAEPFLRQCLAIRDKKLPDGWSRFNTMSMLGGVLLGQGKFADAEPLVVQGYQGMKDREATIPRVGKPRLLEAAERVVHLYEAWGRPNKTTEWKLRLGLADLPADVFARP